MRLFTQRMDTVVETTLRLPVAEDERRVGFGFAAQIQLDHKLIRFCRCLCSAKLKNALCLLVSAGRLCVHADAQATFGAQMPVSTSNCDLSR